MSDSLGNFVARSIAPGAVIIRARKFGFAPMVLTTRVRAGATTSVGVVMGSVASMLPTVSVNAQTDTLQTPDYRGIHKFDLFYQRRAAGMGGQFFTRGQIERRAPPSCRTARGRGGPPADNAATPPWGLRVRISCSSTASRTGPTRTPWRYSTPFRGPRSKGWRSTRRYRSYPWKQWAMVARQFSCGCDRSMPTAVGDASGFESRRRIGSPGRRLTGARCHCRRSSAVRSTYRMGLRSFTSPSNTRRWASSP